MLFTVVVVLQQSNCGVSLFEVCYWIAVDDFAELIYALQFLKLVVERFELTLVSYVHQFVEF